MRVHLARAMVGACLLSTCAPAYGQDAAVLALARSLAYDRKLPARSGEVIDVLVLHAVDDEASRAQGAHVAASLDALPFTVADLRLQATLVPLTNDTLQQVRDADAVFLASGLAEQLPSVLSETRAHDVLSMSFNAAYAEAGVALSLVAKADGRYGVVVNLPGSRAEGAAISPALLQLSEVLR